MCWGQQPMIQNLEDIRFELVTIESDDGLQSWENIDIIYEDREGIIWTVINDGLYRYNGRTAVNVSSYLSKAHNLDTGSQSGICFLKDDENNIIWYGGRKGLYKIDMNTLSSTKVFLDKPLYPANWRNFILKLEQENDTIYVGTANGLYLIDKHSNEVLTKYITSGYDFGHRESSNAVQSIYPDIESGFTWVAAYSGLYRVNKVSGALEQYTLKNAPYILPHNFYKGHLYNNVLLLPSWGLGLVEFDLGTKKFSNYVTQPDLEWNRADNITRSVISLNDSISLTNVTDFGNALFNRHTHKYKWLDTPTEMKQGVFLNVDRSGYIWSSKRGRIFRSTNPVVQNSLPFRHILDVSSFRANDVLKRMPSIEGYSPINLREEERNIDLEFTISKSFVLDTVSYQYQINSEEWLPISSSNSLKLFDLRSGDHELIIRAVNRDGLALAERTISFNIYLSFYKSQYFIGICLLVLMIAIYLFGRYRNNQKMKTENLQNSYEMQLSKLESDALRSQINPHFIFNTLNSIKFYTLKKSKQETMDFISKFSTLIRQVLENSRQNLISAEDELGAIKSYLEIEKLRFDNSFDFSIEVDPNVDLNFLITPMIIQPFIENAIWHGLMHKDGIRNLHIRYKQEQKTLICEVEDNGIGRIAAQEISKNKSHKSSLGIKITEDRLKQLEALYEIQCTFEIIDLYSDDNKALGTKVIIRFKKGG